MVSESKSLNRFLDHQLGIRSALMADWGVKNELRESVLSRFF